MLEPVDGPLVLDFGLAKDLNREPSLTDTGEILGTPAFLAPEQVVPGDAYPVDHRIDVYGLGGLLFFLLTGQPLHPGETSVDVLRHILRNDPPRLRDVDPGLPQPLEVICAKALSRDPRDRYQTANDLADDLARFRAQTGIHARLPGPLVRLQRLARRRPWATTATLGLALALVVGALSLQVLSKRLALHERSQQALTVLALAQEHAADGRHQLAEEEFLEAMLVAKAAYVDDPADERLRSTLARIKRSRIGYAEARGNWSLADELRHNLARLEGGLESSLPRTTGARVPEARIEVHALRPGETVTFRPLEGPKHRPTLRVTSDNPALDLSPGTYVAIHRMPRGEVASSHLVVVDPGSKHALRLDQRSAPPAGVFRLPSRALLEQLD
jgi:hypothetical protein